MAPYAVHITHRTSWHGANEDFDTVYHYDTGVAPSAQGWSDLIDAIVAAERPLYGSDVSFVKARVNGPTDGPQSANQMRFAKDLALAGTSTGGQTLPPELAVIVEFDLGRSPAGYKRILKKWIRGGTIEGTSPTTSQAFGRSALGTTQKTKFITYGNAVKAITIGPTTNNLCNEAGVNFPAANEPIVVNYVHSRQMRRGRKRQPVAP